MAVQRDPVREWREHYARCCLHLDFAPLNDVSFHALVTPIFKGLPIVRTELCPGFVFRDEDLVRDGDNQLWIPDLAVTEPRQYTSGARGPAWLGGRYDDAGGSARPRRLMRELRVLRSDDPARGVG